MQAVALGVLGVSRVSGIESLLLTSPQQEGGYRSRGCKGAEEPTLARGCNGEGTDFLLMSRSCGALTSLSRLTHLSLPSPPHRKERMKRMRVGRLSRAIAGADGSNNDAWGSQLGGEASGSTVAGSLMSQQPFRCVLEEALSL